MFQFIMWFCCCLLIMFMAYRWLKVETEQAEIHWILPKLIFLTITMLSLGYWLFLINAWLFLTLTLGMILSFYSMIRNAQ